MAAIVDVKDKLELVPTEEEKSRFLVAHNGNEVKATEALMNHLAWKETVPLPLPADGSRMRYGKKQMPGEGKLPGWIGMLYDQETREAVKCIKTGTKIVMCFGAMCDLDFSACDYIAATADFLNANLARDSTEKITILVDVRPGEGWKDPAPLKFIPLIRRINEQLSVNFPERVHAIIVYPMPFWAVFIYDMVKVFLDPKTAGKMSLLAGYALIDSPDPPGLREFVDEGVAIPSNMEYYPNEPEIIEPVLSLCG